MPHYEWSITYENDGEIKTAKGVGGSRGPLDGSYEESALWHAITERYGDRIVLLDITVNEIETDE